MLLATRLVVVATICLCGGAHFVPLEEADALSLLQVAAKKHEAGTAEETFGCENQGQAANLWVCGEWGDPHRFQNWAPGEKDDNPNQMGWHWLAKSIDGQMMVQVFLSRNGGNGPVVAAFAGRFGDTTFKVLRKGNTITDFKLIINGELQPDRPTKRFPDGFFIKPRTQHVGFHVGNRQQAIPNGNVAVCMDSGDKRFTLRMDAHNWGGDVPGGNPINMELITDDSLIDKSFPSFCTGEIPNTPQLVKNDDIIVSPEENSELCRIEGLSDADCQDPPVLPPLPPVEQMCMNNGVSYADAQAACDGERAKAAGMFEGCVEDCCASGDLANCAAVPEDFDAMVDEEKGSDDASAVGDPHVTTMKQQKFDVKASLLRAGDKVNQPWGAPTVPGNDYDYTYQYY